MAEEITFHFRLDPQATARAMQLPLGAKMSPGKQIAVGLAIMALAAVAGALAAIVLRLGFGITYAPGLMIAWGLGMFTALFWWRMRSVAGVRRVLGALAALDEAEGGTDATFGPEGITLSSPNARTFLGWPLIVDVGALPGASFIQFGASRMAFPDSALPRGLSPEAFRAALLEWRG